MTWYMVQQWIPDEDAAANRGYWWNWAGISHTLEDARAMIRAAKLDHKVETKLAIVECRVIEETV